MKNINNKYKKIIIVSLSFLVLILALFLIQVNKTRKITVNEVQNIKYPSNFYYKVFSYSSYYKKIQEYYLEKANEFKKIEEKEKKPIDVKEIIENEKPKETNKEQSKELEETIWISSSLTNTAGLISVNGKSQGINVFYLEQLVNKDGQDFNFTAGPTFTVKLEGQKSKTTLTISSPSYGTNKIISQLTLQVNPINMTATIIGQLHLMLPGEIKGSLYNLTNSSSSTTVLKNGYFATSVMLQEGKNLLSASGQWFTIKLDLPSLEVIVTR